MKTKKYRWYSLQVILCFMYALCTSSCVKQPGAQAAPSTASATTAPIKTHPKTIEPHKKENPKTTLDFEVMNKTGQTIYVACFSHIKKRDFDRWRWDKSPVYAIKHNQTATIDIDFINDPHSRKSVHGYLGVFTEEEPAKDAVYELLPDVNKLDLDRLINLKGKRVTIEIERYGFKGKFYEFDFKKKKSHTATKAPELDFAVENKTGKTILATCFAYQKIAKGRWFAAVDDKDDMEAWRYDKTPVITLAPGEIKMINVDTISQRRDREYMRGFLAIFNEDERQLAEQVTYELLGSSRKLNVGNLSRLKNKKIVVEVEQYGIAEDFIDFTIKPTKRINFKKELSKL